ncbi:MAG TPA: class I SAM-dependent methyltransferase [Gammaproteobacteria bacterium]|nr:class I SAM-dependent methyltransferase [Gammaproteobacteria bacterium]
MDGSDYLSEVRSQYEDYPYPQRNPEDEKSRLITTKLDSLAEINHFGYQGKADFRGFRVLVAGGGTGDATIYLAEQLRAFGGEVVYLDISEASMSIARARAQLRALDNITWIHASLLDLPQLDPGLFDYINCTGVLHHLEDPDKGLAALREVLKPSGLIGLLLYGKIGRTAIYQVQELMRLINGNGRNIEKNISRTKEVLAQLPQTNWFKKSENLITDHKEFGDIGIYDLFLHSRDRAYTVREIYDLVENNNLSFTDYLFGIRRNYQPQTWLQQGELLDTITSLPQPEQESIAELIAGDIHMHLFYCSIEPKPHADFFNEENIPYFMLDRSGTNRVTGSMLVEAARNSEDGKIMLPLPYGGQVAFRPNPTLQVITGLVDGERTVGQIADAACGRLRLSNHDRAELLKTTGHLCENFHSIGLMLLRHHTVPAFKYGLELHNDTVGKRFGQTVT